MVTPPRARAGATAWSHAARPGARTPAGSTMSTSRAGRARVAPVDGRSGRPERRRTPEPRLLSPSAIALTRSTAERVVSLHNRLHQLVTHDVAIIEVDEPDAVDVLDDPERLDQA